MKNIFNYIKNYGHLPFSKEPFNDIDNVVFSALSYVDFVKEQINGNLTINKIANIYFKNRTKKQLDNNIIAVKSGIKVLEAIKDTTRYKDLIISGYEYIASDETQFCAMTVKIDDNLSYIAFEGTDHLISGWKEDFELSYKFPVKAQYLAIKYVNKHIKHSSNKVIIGGHSKGGNLAIISSMYCHFWKRKKIIKIYNNDGPGLRKEQIESKKYKLIRNRLVCIIPNYSLVGLLLRQENNYKVVFSYERGLLAHDFVNWKVDGNAFSLTKLSLLSKGMKDGIIKWLDKYNDTERKRFVESLFQVCSEAEIDNLLDYKADKLSNTIKIIKATKNINQETKDMIIELFKLLVKYCSKDIKDGLLVDNYNHD